jgi:hypothetical protein
METRGIFRQLFKEILITGVTLLSVSGCKTGGLKDEVAMLNEKQAFITAQRDSIQRLLNLKSIQYDTVYANYNKAMTEIKTMMITNQSLQVARNKKGDQIKTLNSENEVLTTTISKSNIENDSLKTEIALLQQKVTTVETQKAEAEKSNNDLAGTLKANQDKLVADSVALANKPSPRKVSGFISITEIGGGLGLGDVSVDYSRRLVTLNTIVGYRINDHWISGLGAGVNIYNGGTMIPLYVDLRYIFDNGGKVNPFFVADGGAVVDVKSFNSSGLFINPCFGIQKKLTSRASFHISTGLWIQQAPSGMRNSFYTFKGGVSFRAK